MDDELERLIRTLLDDTACLDCHTEFNLQANELDRESDQIYTTRYSCPGDDCNAGYDVQIEDGGHYLSFEAEKRDVDDPDEPRYMSGGSRKQALQKKSHPVRKLFDAAAELPQLLGILSHNQEQLQKAHETIVDEGIDQDGQFHQRVKADIHNYTAAAYSFEDILEKKLEPHLPSDGPVEDAKNEFEEEHEVIKALRTYAQHHRTLPSSLVHFIGADADDRETTITVPMDDLDDFRPGDSSASFGPVQGDQIDVVDRVNRHYDATENLVETMLEVAEEEYEDKYEEYREATSYPELN